MKEHSYVNTPEDDTTYQKPVRITIKPIMYFAHTSSLAYIPKPRMSIPQHPLITLKQPTISFPSRTLPILPFYIRHRSCSQCKRKREHADIDTVARDEARSECELADTFSNMRDLREH